MMGQFQGGKKNFKLNWVSLLSSHPLIKITIQGVDLG